MTLDEEKLAARAWDIHRHGDLIRIYRMSYGMVAQAMFMVSYVTVLSSSRGSKHQFIIIEIAISIFGIAFTFAQYLLTKSLSAQLRAIRHQFLIDKDPVFTVYERSFINRLGSIQTDWIPASLFLLWLVMLAVSFFVSLDRTAAQKS